MDPAITALLVAAFFLLVFRVALDWSDGLIPLTQRKRKPKPLSAADRVIQAIAAEHAEPDPLDALTPLDVAILTGLGWEPPAEVRRRTERALEAATRPPRVPRPPRQPMSDHQRALADMTDQRIAGERNRSLNQEILAQEADARIARGEVHSFIPPDKPLSAMDPSKGYAGMSLAALRQVYEATRTRETLDAYAKDVKLQAEIQKARADRELWKEALRKEKAAIAELEARIKLAAAFGTRMEFGGGARRTETVTSADGFSRTFYVD